MQDLINYEIIDKIVQYNKKIYQNISTYGKEDIRYITNTMYMNLLKYPTVGLIDLFKLIHYNDQYPENRNIYLDNLDTVNIYTNNGWKPYKMDFIVYSMILLIFNILDNFYKNGIENSDKFLEERFENLRYRVINKDPNFMKFFVEDISKIMTKN